jgi:hypothetical protein
MLSGLRPGVMRVVRHDWLDRLDRGKTNVGV